MARRFSLLVIERLQADVRVTPGGRGAFVLTAKMSSRVVQACTVTQEPVAENIDCVFSVSYSLDSPEYWGSEKGHDSDAGEEYADPPEPIVNGEIDMGECVAEQLILEITPYPRVHGASFVDVAVDAPKKSGENDGVEARVTGRKSPFSVLERLKQNADEKS
ncbi:YceD family protein [Varunaivibrio sulfuroxidans]|uniref:YceD family protein n=1 Tax=Varunaivibrio sulfuroxidans TaxID=1773489 RepID=UPI0014054437|nr:YceD family protein [Varunaivibrio sulfuroxidans]WES31138.1 YceD family protein [Varunaivibrio sulfuroxidans]